MSLFSKCKTLAELNQQRIIAASSGKYEITAVNSEYNVRRQELLDKRPDVKELSCIRIPLLRTEQMFTAIPLGGSTPHPNVIEFKDGKFYI